MLTKEKTDVAVKLFDERRYAEALHAFNEIQKLGRLPPSLLEPYAICLRECFRYNESFNLSEQILKDHPSTAMMLNVCICLGKQGRYKPALEEYEKILKINPGFNINLGYYAYLLERNGFTEKADKIYRQALANEPLDLWYIEHYAFYLQKCKRFDDAKLYYQKAMKTDSSNTWLKKRYALFLNQVDGKDAALKYFKKIIDSDFENCNNRINYAEFLIFSNDYKNALSALNDAKIHVKKDVEEAVIEFYTAVVKIALGDNEGAGNAAKRLKELRSHQDFYIHRDLTDLCCFVENNFDEKEMEAYKSVMECLNRGDSQLCK